MNLTRKKDLSSSGMQLNALTGRSIHDYNMIDSGDKIAVAVSGGRDSLGLLTLLSWRRNWAAVHYDLFAIHVRMKDRALSKKQFDELEAYIQSLDIPLEVVSEDLSGGEKGRKPGDQSCFWCAKKRRKALFEKADKLGCKKLAMGHHKDDIVQTFLMNIFFNSNISTMPPKLNLFKGKLVMIRPFAYAEKNLVNRFARDANIPDLSFNCPLADNSYRKVVENILFDLKQFSPNVKQKIFKALHNIKKEYLFNKSE